ncbi:Dymeclin [Pilaira anomala]|nr:Dymeclin [Pilaira anomala]
MDPNSNYSHYEFYTEVLNTFLVLCSTQLQHSKLTEDNYFLGILISKFGNRAETVVARLLENLIEQRTPPPQSSSVMYTAYNYFFSSRSSSHPDADSMPVADRSLLLLLLLGSQSISKETENSKWIKSYRYAIANLNDHHVLSSDVDGCDRKMHLISFKDLFEIFIKSLHVEERMLLFYFILVENESFRVYVLSRTDQETIYLPILKLIYESVEGKTNYSQVYILMTVLLILSQDDVNNEAIQKIVVHNITWFTERPLLKSISLGGLMTLVLIRTLQLNLSQQKDIYLHTNCLAILANMSNTMSDMHAYVAQRIVSLFELLARRFTKLLEKQPSDDISIYQDLLALILEIINSTLTHRLKHNSQLVYALLQKREIFAPFQLHPRLSDLVQNLEHVINFFHARVSEANLKAPSSNEVLRLIEQASRTWSNSKLPLPDLKFQYEEEQDSYEFFIPYIWALVHRRTFIYWSEEKSHVLDNYRLMNEDNEQQPSQ